MKLDVFTFYYHGGKTRSYEECTRVCFKIAMYTTPRVHSSYANHMKNAIESLVVYTYM